MRRVAIVYESKYGNTAQVAEAIRAALRGAGVSEVVSEKIDSSDVNRVATFDAILVGSPNHIGGPTRRVKKFIRSLAAFDLSGKRLAFFDTYIGGDFGRAVAKMENEFKARNQDAVVVTPGLSLRVEGMKGPLADGELVKGADFGKLVAEQKVNE
ncbi:MAG: flavodoxin family protein [Thermoplasmata archaeon]|nr:flavodoxin family protein [Thermoplasmata archaeon]